MRHLWANGRLLVSATLDELVAVVGPIATDDDPLHVLAKAIGEAGTRAVVAIIRDAVPTWQPEVKPEWRMIGDAEWVYVVTKGGERKCATAGEAAANKAGVLADLADGIWVLR